MKKREDFKPQSLVGYFFINGVEQGEEHFYYGKVDEIQNLPEKDRLFIESLKVNNE